MSGPRLTHLCSALVLAALLLLLPAGAGAQLSDCPSACDQFMSQEGLAGPEAKSQCLQTCQKLKDSGVEGVSLKCAYELPKTCGYELAWDFIRYCVKPCIEFKKEPCEDCLVQHGFCGAVSVCRTWVCKCILKNHDCDNVYHHGCKK